MKYALKVRNDDQSRQTALTIKEKLKDSKVITNGFEIYRSDIEDASNIKNAPTIANNNVSARIVLFKCFNTFTFFLFFIFYHVYYTKNNIKCKLYAILVVSI